MPTYRPDTCSCVSIYTIVNEEMIGELTESCGLHANFDSMIAFNRLKNNSINAISDLFDMTDKQIDWSVEGDQINLTLYNFSPAEMEIVFALNLNTNIIEV